MASLVALFIRCSLPMTLLHPLPRMFFSENKHLNISFIFSCQHLIAMKGLQLESVIKIFTL